MRCLSIITLSALLSTAVTAAPANGPLLTLVGRQAANTKSLGQSGHGQDSSAAAACDLALLEDYDLITADRQGLHFAHHILSRRNDARAIWRLKPLVLRLLWPQCG
ncbi:hypothetical protein A4X09_0g7114 [Tilletia walkeri]|uniref:Uncharacterized protein n=1 Tax=Tilletia walkeri TaxID=117179 RepID=A0A8X7N3U6_9BASI|nr:hypothetical protein A4X09_0g7114 [Tilletia walkeri]